LAEAREFLLETLEDGEKESTDVIEEWAEEHGGSEATLKRARQKMVKKGEMEIVRKFGAPSRWKRVKPPEPTAPADNQDQFMGLLQD
jgi:hypothetical protein